MFKIFQRLFCQNSQTIDIKGKMATFICDDGTLEIENVFTPDIDLTNPLTERPKVPMYASGYLLSFVDGTDEIYLSGISTKELTDLVKITKKILAEKGDWPILEQPCQYLEKPEFYFDRETLEFLGYFLEFKQMVEKSSRLFNFADRFEFYGLAQASLKIYDWRCEGLTEEEIREKLGVVKIE